MGDDYRTKIECEMDRFEAEISSLARPHPPTRPGLPRHHAPPTLTPAAFIPAQLRRQLAPPPPPVGSAAVIAAPPQITRPPQIQMATISGAPQVYRAPSIRPRVPLPQGTAIVQRGVRPIVRPPATTNATATGSPLRPTAATSSPVITGLPVPAGGQPGFIPVSASSTAAAAAASGIGIAVTAAPVPMSIPPTPIASIPLPTEPPPVPEAKPSTSSSGNTDAADSDKKNKKKKDKKPRKLVRCAGGTAWEDPSLQDWDPSDFRLFCGDLGNDVTDEVLTRVFTRYPSFQKARVIRDKRTNKTKGYGFVSFKDPNDFVRAVKELDGRYVGSRPIKLRKSNWKNRNIDVVRKRETERMQLLGINKKPKLF